jgi:hypothetical protein
MMLDGEFVGRHPPTTDVARTSSKRQPECEIELTQDDERAESVN